MAPGFSIAAVLMLAIGLGLVAGAYTVVNGLFIRGWDVPDSGSVFRVTGTVAGLPEGARVDDGLSYGAYKYLRANAKSAEYFSYTLEYRRLGMRQGTAAYSQEAAHYSAGLFVSDNFLTALQIPLQAGPGFRSAQRGDTAQVVISDRLWQKAFDRAPGLVGQSIWVSGVPATVVGITTPSFSNLAERQVDFMVEITAEEQWKRARHVADETSCCVWIVGRKKDGVSMDSARQELILLTTQYRQSTGQPALTVSVTSTAPQVRGGLPVIFALIGSGVMLVWGLTCANVGNLFLARSLRRDREIVVRMALGASRGRVVRQLLAEGLVLAGIAGTAALALAAGVPLVMEGIDGTTAMFKPDLLVAVVAALATGLTCLIVALAPALQATRMTWKDAGRAATRSGRMREVVLAVQIAVATVLVLSATLVGRGLSQAVEARADFALETTTAATFTASGDAKERARIRLALRDAIVREGRGFALVDQAPVTPRSGSSTVVTPSGSSLEYPVTWLSLSRAAIDLLEVPLVEGRAHDDRPEAAEAIVNQRLANRIWPGESAVGKSVRLNYNNSVVTIVGVTRDTHLLDLGDVAPMIHTAPAGNAPTTAAAVVLAASSPTLRERMTTLAASVDPKLQVELTPLSESVQGTLRNAVMGTTVAFGLGAIALLLAVVGVFGVFSYLIEERRREIGIRLALGATRRQVRAALAHACRRPVIAGVGSGMAMAMLAGTLLSGFLFGLSPLDPISYVIVTAVLLFAAVVATAVPVGRALRVDPAVTLRAE